MTSPLVSVIIPCFNAEKFVEKSVRSIMEQTYQNLEIITINDCSTDNTATILMRLAEQDSRIKYICNENNLGLAKTLNKAIQLSTGEYIARMDSDDISIPIRIEKQIDYLRNNPNIDIISTNAICIDENDNIIDKTIIVPTQHKDIINELRFRSALIHPAVLAKRSFFTDLNGFNEETRYAEDYELWIKGWLNKKQFANLPENLLNYRVHANQMTNFSYSDKNERYVRKFLLAYFKQTYKWYFLLGWFLRTRFGFELKKFAKTLIGRNKK